MTRQFCLYCKRWLSEEEVAQHEGERPHHFLISPEVENIEEDNVPSAKHESP